MIASMKRKHVFIVMWMAACSVPPFKPPMVQNDAGADGSDASSGCVKHEDCTSSVCLPNGSCADLGTVAYVDSMGTDNAACMQAQPCVSLQKALATPQSIIKIIGVITENVKILDRDVMVFASTHAKLASATPGILLEIVGNSQVSIFDLEVTGATGPAGDGIRVSGKSTVALERVTISNNALVALYVGAGSTGTVTKSTIDNNSRGIYAQGGTLSVDQTIVSNHVGTAIAVADNGIATITESTITHNQHAGLRVLSDSAVSVVRSTISDNGEEGVEGGASINVKLSMIRGNLIAMSTLGGSVTITQSTIVGNGLGIDILKPTEFHIMNNFFIRNGSSSQYGTGVTIQVNPGTSGEFKFNTIAGNQTLPDMQDSTGGVECRGGFSAPSNLVVGNSGGQNNPPTIGDCDFSKSVLNPSANPAFKGATDYHLTAATPNIILNKADCAGNNVDVDDQPRPNGATCDIGADEYTP